MYHFVKFSNDTTSIICHSWLINDLSCYWPGDGNYDLAFKKELNPTSEWEKFSISKISSSEDLLLLRKLAKYASENEDSDLSSYERSLLNIDCKRVSKKRNFNDFVPYPTKEIKKVNLSDGGSKDCEKETETTGTSYKASNPLTNFSSLAYSSQETEEVTNHPIHDHSQMLSSRSPRYSTISPEKNSLSIFHPDTKVGHSMTPVRFQNDQRYISNITNLNHWSSYSPYQHTYHERSSKNLSQPEVSEGQSFTNLDNESSRKRLDSVETTNGNSENRISQGQHYSICPPAKRTLSFQEQTESQDSNLKLYVDNRVATVVKFMTEEFVEIKLKLDKAVDLLSLLSSPNEAEISSSSNEILRNLPIGNVDDYKLFNDSLAGNPNKKKLMTSWFLNLGGNNYRSACRNFLSRTFANEFTRKITFTGKFKKTGGEGDDKVKFKGTTLHQCIINALQKSFKVSENDINRCLMTWFHHASDREGGRAKRQKDSRRVDHPHSSDSDAPNE